ncbi:MAG: outer membrane beta-barrel family protein [Odoribacteraceae bacterium]|nr:outer membrane beta-barrel family protein [Odoribacteraceae bacterium]
MFILQKDILPGKQYRDGMLPGFFLASRRTGRHLPVRGNGTGIARVNFAKRFWVQGNGMFYLFDSSMPGSFRRDVILDASLSCKFGKNDAGETSLNARDLLNRRKDTRVTMTGEYASSIKSGVLGRSAYISTSYSF